MRIKHIISRILGSIAMLYILVYSLPANAQCAMCRAVAEENMYDESYGYAMGLNTGILMLMAVPYILLLCLVGFFFRRQLGGFLRSFNNIH